jgi:hypothetical protein
MDKAKKHIDGKIKKEKSKIQKPADPAHLGSSNAFEETENPLSRDADNISDEKLDELLGE